MQHTVNGRDTVVALLVIFWVVGWNQPIVFVFDVSFSTVESHCVQCAVDPPAVLATCLLGPLGISQSMPFSAVAIVNTTDPTAVPAADPQNSSKKCSGSVTHSLRPKEEERVPHHHLLAW